jgi:hypothetical protein
MAKKRSAELDHEIREALARIPRKPNLKTREQIDAEIDAIIAGGLPAERYEIAHALGFQYPKKPPPKKMTITDTNIFALSNLVLDAGGKSTISSRLAAVDYPHIKRTLAAGLVEVSSPTTLTLTPEGRGVVLRRLRRDYASQSEALGRDPSRFDTRSRVRVEQMRAAIERLETGT